MRYVLLVFAAMVFAQSQPPSPGPGKPAQNNKSEARSKQAVTSSDQSNANSISAAIDKLTSEVAAWKQQESTKQDKSNTSTEWWAIGSAAISALATIAIAVLAFFQWRTMDRQRRAMDEQADYMRDGLEETRKTAEAANKSANVSEMALKLTQCADVLVDAVSILDPTNRSIAPVDTRSHVAVGFKNFGHTRADNVIFKISLDIPGVPNPDQTLGPGVLGAGDTQTISFTRFGTFLTEQTAEQIKRGVIVMRVEGNVTYTDVFGDPHAIKVMCRYSARHGLFRKEEHPDNEQTYQE